MDGEEPSVGLQPHCAALFIVLAFRNAVFVHQSGHCGCGTHMFFPHGGRQCGVGAQRHLRLLDYMESQQ
jgi:hypothetical protein